jgi:hypothetical protein
LPLQTQKRVVWMSWLSFCGTALQCVQSFHLVQTISPSHLSHIVFALPPPIKTKVERLKLHLCTLVCILAAAFCITLFCRLLIWGRELVCFLSVRSSNKKCRQGEASILWTRGNVETWKRGLPRHANIGKAAQSDFGKFVQTLHLFADHPHASC